MFRFNLSQSLLVSRALTALAVIVAGWLIYRVGKTVIARVATPKFVFREESSRQAATARALLLSTWKYVALFLVLAALVALLPSALVPTLALTTVFGLVIAFGAQSLMRDILAGFSIILEGQFAVGDRVRLYGVEAEGTVEGVGLRVTVIRDEDGSRVFVPNGAITAIRNFTMAPAGSSAERGRSRGGRGRGGRGVVERTSVRTSDARHSGRGDSEARTSESRTIETPAREPQPAREPHPAREPQQPREGQPAARDPQRRPAAAAASGEPDAGGDEASAATDGTSSVRTGQRRTRRGGRGRGGRGSGTTRPTNEAAAASQNEAPISGWPIDVPESSTQRQQQPSPRAEEPRPEQPAPRPAQTLGRPAPAPQSEPATVPQTERPAAKPEERSMDDSPWSVE